MNDSLTTRIARTTINAFDYDLSKWEGIAISVLYPVAGAMGIVSVWCAVTAILDFLNAPTPVSDVALALTGHSLALAFIVVTVIAIQRVRILAERDE